ncbi:unnamed protein product [Hanseniaspora opuntiae]
MFPGNQHNTYNRTSASIPQTNQYQRPSVPPPQTTQYQRPSVSPPQTNQYQRPSAPPPQSSQNQQAFLQPISNQTNTSPQFSNRSPRRKALVIGCSYMGTQNELRGCISDALRVNDFLVQRCGYAQDDIVILRDDIQGNPRMVPTRENIIAAMQWLVNDAIPGDCLFLSYSGHGTQVDDLDGDEDDGKDDAICPVDFKQNGLLIDDVIHDIIVKPLPQGCKLTALMDCCHSGSVLDLPFTYSTKGVLKKNDSSKMYKNLGMQGLNMALSYASGSKSSMFSSAQQMFSTMKNGGSRLTAEQQARVQQMKYSPADVMSISGCKDDQTSADTYINNTNTGALTWAFLEVLQENPSQSYVSLLNNIRNKLAGKYTQKPQFAFSHEVNPNDQFTF